MLKAVMLAAALLAQVAPQMQPMPMRPMPGRPDLSDGITVTGSGVATAPASSAQVTLHLSTRNNAQTLTQESLQWVVDALTQAGAQRASVMLPAYLVGQARTNNAAITAEVAHPTQAMLQQGLQTLVAAFAAHPDVLLNSAEVRLSADGCATLQRSATANAIANARANATFDAQQIGVRVGSVLAIEQTGLPAPGAPGACTTIFGIGPYGPQPQVFSEMLTVKVFAYVTMRFGIRHS